MRRIFFTIACSAMGLLSCTSNESVRLSALGTGDLNDTIIYERSADEDVEPGTLIFKHQFCYKFLDELGNAGEYEIAYQPATGIMYVITSEVIPRVEGILIYPEATYKILGQNEQGKKISLRYNNGKDLVVQLADEAGVAYPQKHPYIDYHPEQGSAMVYRDGLKGSRDFIKSKRYTINNKETGDTINLHLTEAYPQLNARLLYGLAHIPGDVGAFFKRYGELWNISSKQWPTLLSGKGYSIEMFCYSDTDYHVDLSEYSAL